MNEEQYTRLKEIRRIIRLLERMRSLAQEATMTGALRNGQGYAIQQYNGIVAALVRSGLALPDYFPPVEEDANWGAVGFASAQLAEYLKEEVPEAEGTAGEGGANPFGGFNEMFEGFFGERGRASRGEPAREAQAAAGPAEGAGPGPGAAERRPNDGARRDLERRLAELGARIEAVAEQMRQEGLPPEELQRLAAELSRLGQEQARIAQEAA